MDVVHVILKMKCARKQAISSLCLPRTRRAAEQYESVVHVSNYIKNLRSWQPLSIHLDLAERLRLLDFSGCESPCFGAAHEVVDDLVFAEAVGVVAEVDPLRRDLHDLVDLVFPIPVYANLDLSSRDKLQLNLSLALRVFKLLGFIIKSPQFVISSV